MHGNPVKHSPLFPAADFVQSRFRSPSIRHLYPPIPITLPPPTLDLPFMSTIACKLFIATIWSKYGCRLFSKSRSG